MTISKGWSAFFVAAALVVSVETRADLKFSLEPSVIQPGQRATLTVRLPEKDLLATANEEENIPQAEDDFLVKTANLELLDQDYRKMDGDYIWKYQLTSYQPGELAIPPIAIKMGPQTFSTERTLLKVETTRAGGDLELRPDAGQVSTPWDKAFWFTLLLLLGIGAIAYWYAQQWFAKLKPRRRDIIIPIAPRENPLDWLRKQLLVLRAKVDAHPEDRLSPDNWTLILREYVERSIHKPVTAWTTTEMRGRLQSDGKMVALSELMTECDRFKFSGRGTSAPAKLSLHLIEESERLFL